MVGQDFLMLKNLKKCTLENKEKSLCDIDSLSAATTRKCPPFVLFDLTAFRVVWSKNEF